MSSKSTGEPISLISAIRWDATGSGSRSSTGSWRSPMNAMRWRKLGKIFDPTEHALPNDCVQFAQSPQALVFDEFIRVYFSTRALDKSNGKPLSHVAFVDL